MANKNKRACRYCGDEKTGLGCQYAPKGIHVAIGDETECIYCKSTNYGKGCQFSLEKDGVHKHGHSTSSPLKCVWCGSTSKGGGCPFSPTGKHQY